MSMIKLGLILAAYAVASCFCLAIVNNITAPVIAQHQADKVGSTLKVVFKDADSFSPVTDFAADGLASTIDALYVAKKGDKVTGAVTQITGATYDSMELRFRNAVYHIVQQNNREWVQIHASKLREEA